MRTNVLTELRQPVGTVSQIDVLDLATGGANLEVRNLRGTANLMRTDRGLLVDFEGTAVTEATCSRCLTETECEVLVAFKEEYVPVIDPTTRSRVRSGFEPDAFRISPDYTLDLREGIRQYLLISESPKPLCRPDCAGLCPECGADLNRGLCSCTSLDLGGAPTLQPIDLR